MIGVGTSELIEYGVVAAILFGRRLPSVIGLLKESKRHVAESSRNLERIVRKQVRSNSFELVS
jgi:Sec-independent protein translocase protein TatA